MHDDIVPLTKTQLLTFQQAWLDQLGKTNGDRLSRLLPLFETGKASLAEALEIIAPGKDRRSRPTRPSPCASTKQPTTLASRCD
jgi:hypothetical protein